MYDEFTEANLTLYAKSDAKRVKVKCMLTTGPTAIDISIRHVWGDGVEVIQLGSDKSA